MGARSQRIAWLEGVRIFAAAMILIYHAQLLITDYAYTPQPTGLLSNLRSLLAATGQRGVNPILATLSLPTWFGFQFVDVFVLISGFSLVLSLKGRPPQWGLFLRQRSLRILGPFWTVVWLSYPILWLLGTWTDSYIPTLWHFFAAATFPLLFDYAAGPLLPMSGPWWFVSLILSLILIFPFLWNRLQQWGARNLLLVSALITVIYRALAVYAFGGHPTYVILETPANWLPFLTLLSKLSTFVIGMVTAQAYLRQQGPLFWKPQKALLIGFILYTAGFIGQFYPPGWIVADLLTPLGLLLGCMTLFRQFEQVLLVKLILIRLGSHSYSYFLIHNFVIDRTVNLFIKNNLQLYPLSLPFLMIGTLLLAIIVDQLQPHLKQAAILSWQKCDQALSSSPIEGFDAQPKNTASQKLLSQLKTLSTFR